MKNDYSKIGCLVRLSSLFAYKSNRPNQIGRVIGSGGNTYRIAWQDGTETEEHDRNIVFEED